MATIFRMLQAGGARPLGKTLDEILYPEASRSIFKRDAA
jgi:hypothetical protein